MRLHDKKIVSIFVFSVLRPPSTTLTSTNHRHIQDKWILYKNWLRKPVFVRTEITIWVHREKFTDFDRIDFSFLLCIGRCVTLHVNRSIRWNAIDAFKWLIYYCALHTITLKTIIQDIFHFFEGHIYSAKLIEREWLCVANTQTRTHISTSYTQQWIEWIHNV